jgi:Heparinase II/III-like protein/Heparinase II/III N-terminus
MIILSKRISLYYHTLRYLTFRQIYYQVIHRLKKTFLKQLPSEVIRSIEIQLLNLLPSIPSRKSYLGNRTFIFLNKRKVFVEKIDWDFIGFEKLWVYNLNYFDFLLQEEISKNDSIQLLDQFCDDVSQRKEGIEPYPISMRGINWIKFFTYYQINKHKYNSVLYSHYRHLANNLEYHLLGNHLLENGFSLLFGAYYFRDEGFYKKSRRILFDELNEQILNDGAHFELSPMYHQIILFRLLDSINLLKNNLWNHNDDLLIFLEEKARKMLGWIKIVTFSNGEIPMVNDSAVGIAPNTFALLHYGKRLGIESEPVFLSDSGYRMIREQDFELFIDIGNIGPDYIPGHAHSDTFNFILYVKGFPVIVDRGISTYNRNLQRIIERSTESHNTVRINELEQSEVWASFRVGRRAKVINVNEQKTEISAVHNGYHHLGIYHQRTWKWEERKIKIIDSILGEPRITSCIAYFHFHPDVNIQVMNNLITAGNVALSFTPNSSHSLEDYDFAKGFNVTKTAKRLRVSFTKTLETTIIITTNP